MATVYREVLINMDSANAWAALRDVGNVHKRLARGHVIDCRFEAGTRVLTYATGLVVRQAIVSIDDALRRFVYTVIDNVATHYNGSMQVFSGGAGRSRLVWIVDVLPDAVAAPVEGVLEQGLVAIVRTLESGAPGPKSTH